MIRGVGIDLIDLERIAGHVYQEAFVRRVLTDKEREVYQQMSSKRKLEFLAGHFSAKEAYAKARGTGIGSTVSFQDLTIVHDELGRPLLEDRNAPGDRIHLSITHTARTAAAFVVIEDAAEPSAY